MRKITCPKCFHYNNITIIGRDVKCVGCGKMIQINYDITSVIVKEEGGRYHMLDGDGNLG